MHLDLQNYIHHQFNNHPIQDNIMFMYLPRPFLTLTITHLCESGLHVWGERVRGLG